MERATSTPHLFVEEDSPKHRDQLQRRQAILALIHTRSIRDQRALGQAMTLHEVFTTLPLPHVISLFPGPTQALLVSTSKEDAQTLFIWLTHHLTRNHSGKQRIYRILNAG